MDFEKNVPEWKATGTEPPESLKESGFQAGYKPPATFFNWFWNSVSACLTEIRKKLSGHADDKNNPHGVTADQVGLGKVNNTADADKSVKFASESASARKVGNKFLLRFNGGSTEGTNLFTYDGSTGKSVNITPDKIDAAKKDLSNVTNEAFSQKVVDAGLVEIPIVEATSTDGVAYTATVDGVTELKNGMLLTIIPNMTSTSTAVTLNVNGLGAKIVRVALSFNNAATTTPRLANYYNEGRPLTLQFDANYTTGGAWKTIKQRTSAQDLYGTVPVESGGTGAEDAAGARKNLEITPANIGAFPVTGGRITGSVNINNGTGYSHLKLNREVDGTDHSAACYIASNGAMRIDKNTGATSSVNYLSLSDTATSLGKPLDVNGGGTGATTAAAARANIGAVSMTTARFYLQVADWDNSLQQTVSVSGVTANSNVIVSPSASTHEAYHNAMVRCSAQADGTLTFTAAEKPTSRLFVYVLILN